MWPTAEQLIDAAREAGFDLAGLGAAQTSEDARHFEAWIAAGRHGSMHYLGRQQEKIQDVNRWLPGIRSGLSLAIDYGSAAGELGKARIARYASFRDYHRVFESRMKRMLRSLALMGFGREQVRTAVDAVPYLERGLAVRAGVGFRAKSSGIIHASQGPFLLLGEILMTEDYEPSLPPTGSCGTCTACLDACPTQAIVAPFEVDARKCLSYSTIENRGITPRDLRKAQGEWLFGCDICLDCCPFVNKSQRSAAADELRPHRVVESYSLRQVLELDDEAWNRDWTGTAMRRATRSGMQRNAAIVLGNLLDESACGALAKATHDADIGLRTAAAWALASIGSDRQSLENAHACEADEIARADLAVSLESFGRI